MNQLLRTPVLLEVQLLRPGIFGAQNLWPGICLKQRRSLFVDSVFFCGSLKLRLEKCSNLTIVMSLPSPVEQKTP